jgi:protein ImuB
LPKLFFRRSNVLTKMAKLFACIISNQDFRAELISVAKQFAYRIETLDDGIVFDVSGLEKLIGDYQQIAEAIKTQLIEHDIYGSVTVNSHLNSAILLAQKNYNAGDNSNEVISFNKLPLRNLEINRDTLSVFGDLGISRIEELRQIPHEQLISRYGQEFREIIDAVNEADKRSLKPNLKENKVSWKYDLDESVNNYEQLVFLLNRGLDSVCESSKSYGYSTEQLDICFGLIDKTEKLYEIKTSFPTLEKNFWLKLINLRISFEIISLGVTLHFAKSRPVQTALYAAPKPTPESLLLTVNKLKKLLGEENVGVPSLLDQRLAEAFTLDSEKLPIGKESKESIAETEYPIISFSYFKPPISAQVLIRDKRLIYLKTDRFRGRVEQYSGVWKANSRWWEKIWKTNEWDVEIENGGVYRLCKRDTDWFVVGEYD